jgi:hypothetical protein
MCAFSCGRAITAVLCPGRTLLETVLQSVTKHPNIVRIYLHVQTSNADALSFYSKFGFSVVDTIKDYYKRISPPDCHVLAKDLAPPPPAAAAAPGADGAAPPASVAAEAPAPPAAA